MTRRELHAIVIGGFVVLAAGIVRLAPKAVRGYAALKDETGQTVALAMRAEASVAELQEMRVDLSASGRELVALAPLLLGSGSRARSVAALGDRLQGWAESYGIVINRMDSAPDSAARTFTRLSLDLQLEGDLDGLARLIAAIETGEEILTVDRLVLENAGSLDASPQVLRCNLRVSGWMLGGNS